MTRFISVKFFYINAGRSIILLSQKIKNYLLLIWQDFSDIIRNQLFE